MSLQFIVLTSVAQIDDFYPTDPSEQWLYYENNGQLIDNDGNLINEYKFYTDNSPVAMFMKQSEMSFVWTSIVQDTVLDTMYHDSLYRLDMGFGSSAQSSNPEGIDKTDLYLNYYLPHCSSGSEYNYGYERVQYADLYDGVDVEMYSNASGPKIYISADPNRDASQLTLDFDGMTSYQVLNNQVTLQMSSKQHSFTLPAPYAYTIDGSGTTELLAWQPNYIDNGNGSIGFQLFSYDQSKTLVIAIAGDGTGSYKKPQNNGNLEWSTYYGGAKPDEADRIIESSGGKMYSSGITSSIDFPTKTGAVYDKNQGGEDIFLISFDEDEKRTWTTYYGSSDDEGDGASLKRTDICVSSQGYITLGTTTKGDDAPLAQIDINQHFDQNNSFQKIDLVLTQFTGAGKLRWATYMGENYADYMRAIYCDGNDNIWIAFQTTDFSVLTPPVGSPLPYFSNSGGSAIVKVNQNCEILYSTRFSAARIYDIFVSDHDEDVFITGLSNGNLPVKTLSGAYNQQNMKGTFDAFIARFDDDFVLEWCTYFGGNDNGINAASENGLSIIEDKWQNLYVCGNTLSNNGFPLKQGNGYFDGTYGGQGGFVNSEPRVYGDAFLAKFDDKGEQLVTTYYGYEGPDYLSDLSCDKFGNIYAVGAVGSDDLDMANPNLPGAYVISSHSDGTTGRADKIILMFDPDFNLGWSTYFGGVNESGPSHYFWGEDVAQSCHITSDMKFYVAGFSLSNELPTQKTTGFFQKLRSGSYDVSIQKFDMSSTPAEVKRTIESEHAVSLYPNPFVNELVVELESLTCSKVNVRNSLGQLVFTKTTNFKSPQLKLNTEAWMPGAYFISLTNDTTTLAMKVVKVQ